MTELWMAESSGRSRPSGEAKVAEGQGLAVNMAWPNLTFHYLASKQASPLARIVILVLFPPSWGFAQFF